MQRLTIILLLFAIFIAFCPKQVQATYPNEAINIIIPFSPGGGSDRLTRILDQFTKKEFGHNFVFVYKPGAGGAVGADQIAKAPKDGYWIGTINVPQIVTTILTGAGSFTLEDFDYICQVSSEPMVLVTPAKSRIKSLEQFIEESKKTKGSISLGVPGGLQSSTWLSTHKLRDQAKIEYTRIPFKGGSDLNANLLGGHVDAGFGNLGVLYSEKDKLNFIAVTSPERHFWIPEVPTFKEKGVNIIDATRRLYVVPNGLEPSKLDRLRQGFKKIFINPDYQMAMKKAKWDPDWMGGEALKPFIKEFADEFKTNYEKYKDK